LTEARIRSLQAGSQHFSGFLQAEYEQQRKELIRVRHFSPESWPNRQGRQGEVYLARDPEGAARFQREAEVLAALNHPNIAAIYGVAEAENVRALVMEYVEGESPRGPMSFEDAWKIMTQVAAGLEYAHERRVVPYSPSPGLSRFGLK